MSAYRQCMFLLRKSPSIKNFKRCFSVANRTRIYASRLNALGILKYPWHSATVTFYSTQKGGSNDMKNLTDEILKSKLTSRAKDNPENADDKNEGDKNEGNKNEDKKEKSGSWYYIKKYWPGLGLGVISLTVIFMVEIFGSEEKDISGEPIKDEYSDSNTVVAHLCRCYNLLKFAQKNIAEPSRTKLLPDPLEYPYMQPPYTLVIEMTDVLVHPDWGLNTGWRFKKRKGIDYFLSKAGPPLFEIVIYTAENGMTADHIVNNLDPQGYITYRLYRDTTKYKSGVHIKDLDCLNRDLSKVIMVDSNVDSVQLHKNNSLVIKPWKGEEDTVLYDLANFLHTVASSGVADVRTVLEYYQQFEDPIAVFKENLKRLQEEQEKQKALEQAKAKPKINIVPAWKR